MRKRKNKMKKKILMSLSQIFILIIGIFAISYAFGSEVRVVSGAETTGICICARKIPYDLGPFGAYRERGYNEVKDYLKDSAGKIIPQNEIKYYINVKLEGKTWDKETDTIYGARDLAVTHGVWYYYYWDSPRRWEKITGKPEDILFNIGMDKCEEAWKYTNLEQREKVEEILNKDTTTKSDETTKTSKEKCLDECKKNFGRSTTNGYCISYRGYPSGNVNLAGNHQVDLDVGNLNSVCGVQAHCVCEIPPNQDANTISDTEGNPAELYKGMGTIPNLLDKTEEDYKECKVGTKITSKTNSVWNYEGNNIWKCTSCDSKSNEYKQGKNICDYYNNDVGSKEGKCVSGTFKCGTPNSEKGAIEKDKTNAIYKEAPLFGGTEWYSYLFGHIAEGAIWAGGIFAANTLLQGFLPEEYHDLADTYAWSLFGAVLAGKTVTGALEAAFPGMRAVETGKKGITISKAGWIGIGAAAAYFVLAFRYETYEVITFTCQPWDAPTGGDHCDECNQQGILPCSEYQCRSLGQACELINKGTDEERCAWINRGDVEFPRIEPWEEALINENYVYNPDDTISPPDRGVRIQYTEAQPSQCVPAFTPLSFGIKLTNEDGEPEPAKCKLDTARKESFDDMRFYFSDGLLLEEHSYSLSLPGAGGDVEIENDGEYSIYVRCQDANGNYNSANFVFNFCVDQGPDTTPPLIVQTSIPSGMPIAFNQTLIDLEVYVNEPVADCRWSHLDQGYENMEGEMDCTGGDNLNDVNSLGLYTCETTLDGIKDRQENKFYFRCEDTTGNINEESYEFILIGTQPLVIDWVKPENESIIRDSTEAVKVTLEARTSAGYDEGASNCYFSDTGEEDNYPLFLGDGDYSNYEHSQDLWLREGSYEYLIKCCDLGNNCDYESINFEVESDSTPPLVVRAYHEETYLKIITNEAARCVYDTKYENYPCDYVFDDGTSMTTLEEVNHYTSWNPQMTFYIRCQDEYGIQPAPDECSIIVRPSDLY
jgi:hypothetical protein